MTKEEPQIIHLVCVKSITADSAWTKKEDAEKRVRELNGPGASFNPGDEYSTNKTSTIAYTISQQVQSLPISTNSAHSHITHRKESTMEPDLIKLLQKINKLSVESDENPKCATRQIELSKGEISMLYISVVRYMTHTYESEKH